MHFSLLISMASGDKGTTSGVAGQDNLEPLMKDLGLHEEDLADVVFEEEGPPTRRIFIG